MGYFDDEKHVQDYIKMADGFDGAQLIEVLKQFLPEQSTLLELGMGPGKDLDILKKNYQATGSDSSQVFVDLYRSIHPEADILLVDAVTMKLDRKFDCIYSNKVLHHLTRDDLKMSLVNQQRALNFGGILFHSFWHGDKEETHHGLRFAYYVEKQLKELVEGRYQLLEMKRYSEMEENDSVYVVLRSVGRNSA